MKSIADLYACTEYTLAENWEPLFGCYYNHIPEINDDQDYFDKRFLSSDEVQIRLIKDVNFDGRRIWRLATVWFEGQPIMVIQNAGREGDDHRRRYVTDADGLMSMAIHVRRVMMEHQLSQFEPAKVPESDKYTSEYDSKDLLSFYDSSLASVDSYKLHHWNF